MPTTVNLATAKPEDIAPFIVEGKEVRVTRIDHDFGSGYAYIHFYPAIESFQKELMLSGDPDRRNNWTYYLDGRPAVLSRFPILKPAIPAVDWTKPVFIKGEPKRRVHVVGLNLTDKPGEKPYHLINVTTHKPDDWAGAFSINPETDKAIGVGGSALRFTNEREPIVVGEVTRSGIGVNITYDDCGNPIKAELA